MALQPVYLVAAKNLGSFLEAIRHAQAPEKMSLKFIEDLGFRSTNDRLFVPLLKAMKFLDDAGRPLARYHAFLDDNEWKGVLADGIRDAYSDLFRVNKNAQNLSREQLTGKIKSLGEGKLSQSVVTNTAKTFIELVKLADFSAPPKQDAMLEDAKNAEDQKGQTGQEGRQQNQLDKTADSRSTALVYRIEIVLPAVRDQAIYDAIFRSAKEHLLR
ncbi:MAG: DUF5343 domain-containing protein [Pseudomonadota bacterium]